MSGVPWSELYRRRQEVSARYPSLFRVPRIRRATRLARARLRPGVRILDVGAGERRRGAALAAAIPDAVAVSVDPDPAGGQDHARVEDVEGRFDLALALEVIEHLPIEEGVGLLRSIRERLVGDGILVVSTPNVFCPGRFLRDATHVTPYAWDELGGVMKLAGFELVRIYRVWPGNVLRRSARTLVAPLGRALGIDLAPSIAATGKA
jgi:2-polyprenyl-3-methyl-5-hydroxy-6-metoxy-1,4-benzoquinol methylase